MFFWALDYSCYDKMGVFSQSCQIQITYFNLFQSVPLLRLQISESVMNRVWVMNMVVMRGTGGAEVPLHLPSCVTTACIIR